MDRIDALLDLLDDPDPTVHEALLARLGSDDELLDRAWQVAAASGRRPTGLVELVLRADAEALVDAFAEADELEAGVWLLPRLDQPRLDHRTSGTEAIDHLAARLPRGSDANAVARFLCDDCGFSGARRDYDDPANSFMPRVLERRVGLPITLGVLWALVCRRLDAACELIALPGHVVGRWPGGYLDLYAGGRAIERVDLDRRVRAVGEASAAPYLAPASDRALLRRMARNLVHAYAKRDDKLRATIAHGLATA
jgi:regulator of sirC expression with transglutaminase-like and TPR domain